MRSRSFPILANFHNKIGSTRGIANGQLFPKLGKLWPTLPQTKFFFENIEQCKNFSNTFLVHHLVELNEVWHGKGHMCTAGLLLFW